MIDTLPATLVVVETILQYHWLWCRKLALVRDVMLNGESVRRLRQYVRPYLSDSVQWSEVFAAIYVDPARIFPLAGSGQVKKQQ